MFNTIFCPYCGKSLPKPTIIGRPIYQEIEYYSPSDLDHKLIPLQIEYYLGCQFCKKELQNEVIINDGGNTYWLGK